MNIHIIIGLGFGDEGKGRTTNYLCQHNDNSLVIRFNGGHQAGHTVWTKDGKNHVFSNFGAGTLQGVATYWAKHCTLFVNGLLKEWEHIKHIAPDILGKKPILYIDEMCPVTTHYDVLSNRITEDNRQTNRHGSCGVGFGATMARHTLTPFKFYAQDLLFEDMCKQKLEIIRNYYASKTPDFQEFEHEEEDMRFLENVKKLKDLQKNHTIEFVKEPIFFKENVLNYQNLIFEGAQGVLLDMDFGFFPNVTRSNTTSKNAISLITQYLPQYLQYTEIYYITRCYQTRHGAGIMANEIENFPLQNNEHETNQTHNYQGHFRKGFLNIEWLKYAISCDENFSGNLQKNLVLTCLDQIENPNKIPYILGSNPNTEVLFYDYKNLKNILEKDFKKCFYGFGKADEWEI